MRILLANDDDGSAGGVQTYLDAVGRALHDRGHTVALLNGEAQAPEWRRAEWVQEEFCVRTEGHEAAFRRMRAWRADIRYSQNMGFLDVERALLDDGPVVKMMHGYAGTCISGQKAHLQPRQTPCTRKLGATCLAMYHARGCGGKSLKVMAAQYAQARAQQLLFPRYSAIVVGSEHMRLEFVRNGAPADRITTVPLFSVAGYMERRITPAVRNVLFIGRMTRPKGGDALIRAVAHAQKRSGATVALVMAGDGPARNEWSALARRLGVNAEFPGWIDQARRDALCRTASVLAVPSVWPEPFGLVGLEAAVHGVPAIAFDVGGISEWLRDGENGVLVRGARPSATHFGNALAELLHDREALERLSRGAQRMAGDLSVSRHTRALEEILTRAGRAA